MVSNAMKNDVLRTCRCLFYFLFVQIVLIHPVYTDTNSSTIPYSKVTENIVFNKSNLKVVCNNEEKSCTVYLQNITSQSQVKLMAEYTESMFNIYANNSYMSADDMKVFLFDIGVLKPASTTTDSHAGHDHDYSLEDLYDAYSYDYIFAECLEKVDDLIEEYYSTDTSSTDVKISLVDFYVMLPRLIYQLQDSSCSSSDEDHDHEHTTNSENRGKVWGVALGSVAIISALAVVGICIVPLMKHSIYFNRLISFLVALAVGTLVGDALLHLLPHSMGSHDHSGHDHGDSNHGQEEKNVIYKSLVAVVGIYLFFLMESVMGLIRERKQGKHSTKQQQIKPCNEPLMKENNRSDSHNSNSLDKCSLSYIEEAKENNIHAGANGDGIAKQMHLHQDKESVKLNDHSGSEVSIELPCQHHHHHPDLTDATGIKDMAWMIIMGDGLHNLSDGLAIGAAFSSSMSAGLSTSLAIFCHELPHELGDFAILISAGMSVKQAIIYNILSACCAFIGVIIGLAIGEFSESIKLWILAITAGGFLYVALVGMLPQLLNSSAKKDGLIRFVVQNVGLIFGILIMLFIALYEEKFYFVFS